MAWVKLDDQFFVNRKARAVGPGGRALFLASVCYCGMQLNDGRFTMGELPVIAALAEVDPDVCHRLFQEGLWHLVDSDLVEVHDYLRWNRSRSQVVAAEEAGRQAAERRWKRNAKPNAIRIAEPNTDLDTENHTRHSSSGNSRANPQPVDDDDEPLADVPPEVWVYFADIKLAQQKPGTISNTVAWKRRCRENANLEHGDKAARWWHDYKLTARYLAECLVAGDAPRNEYRRKEHA